MRGLSSSLPCPITDLSIHGQRLKITGHKFCPNNEHITSIRLFLHKSLAAEKALNGVNKHGLDCFGIFQSFP